MNAWPEHLYRLLPAVYQIRDGEERESLRALVHVVGEQVQEVQDDIEQLLDNWFIETCQDWVVPYIGDLVGFRRVEGAGEPSDAVTARGRLLNRFLFPRREIANLVRRRRRKGTLSVLEDVANDVTGWPARAVEFSRLITFFQSVKHPQPELGRTISIREREATVRVNTPFDRIAHTVDVRQIQALPGAGWYHPRKVGLFVWRRKVFSFTKITPCQVCDNIQNTHVRSFTFSRLGQEAPLYVLPASESDPQGIAAEPSLPVPLYRHLLADSNGRASTVYYGLGTGQPKSLAIWVQWSGSDGLKLVPADRVHVCDLSDSGKRKETAGRLQPCHVAVDPECGRFLVNTCERPCEVSVSYHYSFGAEVGGGEYERAVAARDDVPTIRIRTEDCRAATAMPQVFRGAHERQQRTRVTGCRLGRHSELPLVEASPQCTRERVGDECYPPQWIVQQSVTIEIGDSGTYEIPANETVLIQDGVTLEVRGARGAWPFIQIRSADGNVCANAWHVRLGEGSKLILDGLQICGSTLQLVSAVGTEAAREDQGRSEPACWDVTRQTVPQQKNCDASRPDTCKKPAKAAELHIRHTTFVPGGRAANSSCACLPNHASLTIRHLNAHVCIQHSIVGTFNIEHTRCRHACSARQSEPPCPVDPIQLSIQDSIVDAALGLPAIYSNCCAPAHADLTIERSTVLGHICVQQISRAEDSLFAGIVHAKRRGLGFMRFCFVPKTMDEIPLSSPSNRLVKRIQLLNSLEKISKHSIAGGQHELPIGPPAPPAGFQTPPRFKCLPDTAGQTQDNSCTAACGVVQTLPIAAPRAGMRPEFVSITYGHPGYCQLDSNCPPSVLRGAEDESEPGVFHDLYHPQRDAALRARLEEYTPAEMQSAVIYADDLYPMSFVKTPSDTQ